MSLASTPARKSNIELMRIILFVMVVSLHISGPYLTSHFYTGTLEWQFSNMADGFSRLGSIGFVLIAAYFMSSSKSSRSWRRVLKLLPPLAFYFPLYLVLYNMDKRAAGALTETTKLFWNTPFCKAALDFLKADGHFYPLWYVQVFIATYLLAPFLNTVIDHVERQDLKRLITVLFLLTSGIPTLVYITGIQFYRFDLFASNLGFFVTLYLISAYIRRYVDIKTPAKTLFAVFLGGELSLVFLSFLYNSRYSPLIFFNKLMGITMTYPFSGFLGNFYERTNSLVLATGIAMFLFFLKLDFSSKPVNNLASKTYGAYIVHVFWINILTRYWAVFSRLTYIPATIALIISVVVLSFATEYLRHLLGKLFMFWGHKSDVRNQ